MLIEKKEITAICTVFYALLTVLHTDTALCELCFRIVFVLRCALLKGVSFGANKSFLQDKNGNIYLVRLCVCFS